MKGWLYIFFAFSTVLIIEARSRPKTEIKNLCGDHNPGDMWESKFSSSGFFLYKCIRKGDAYVRKAIRCVTSGGLQMEPNKNVKIVEDMSETNRTGGVSGSGNGSPVAKRSRPIDDIADVRTDDSVLGNAPNILAKYTTLVGGETYNITWRMAYPHQGGYKLFLLSSNGEPLGQLSEWSGSSPFAGLNDQTSTSHVITLPNDMTCKNCTLQLERQAKERGSSYWFWSCSDVTIIPNTRRFSFGIRARNSAPVANNCMGNGRITSTGYCRCNRRFSGEMCQCEDDCWTDSDCTGRGRCTDLKTSGFPRRVCFCAPSYYGQQCQKKFKPQMLDIAFGCFNYFYPRRSAVQGSTIDRKLKYNLFNPGCYEKQSLTSEDMLYWRKIGSQLEVVLEVKSKSWTGLGWRPQAITSECRKFPVDSSRKTVGQNYSFTSDPVPEPENVLPAVTRNYKRKGNRAKEESAFKKQTLNYLNIRVVPTPSVNVYSKTTKEVYNWKQYVKQITDSPIKSNQNNSIPPSSWYYGYLRDRSKRSTWRGVRRQQAWQPLSWCQAPETQYFQQYFYGNSRRFLSTTTHPPYFEPKIPDLPKPESESEPTVEPRPKVQTSLPKPEPEPVDNREQIVDPEPEPNGGSSPEPEPASEGNDNNLHAMDCIDIVVGAASKDHSYVGDYYTRDRSTPLRDNIYGGSDSLTAAYGIETYDGKTIVMFRKPITANQPSDHSLGPGILHVVWAKGQEFGNYSHAPPSAVEISSNERYYKPKKLMYHGKNNRRVFSIEFVPDELM